MPFVIFALPAVGLCVGVGGEGGVCREHELFWDWLLVEMHLCFERRRGVKLLWPFHLENSGLQRWSRDYCCSAVLEMLKTNFYCRNDMVVIG